MRTSVRAARLMPRYDYQRALIIAEAEAEAPKHRQIRESIEKVH